MIKGRYIGLEELSHFDKFAHNFNSWKFFEFPNTLRGLDLLIHHSFV